MKKILIYLILSIISFSYNNDFKININDYLNENRSKFKSMYILDEDYNIYYNYNETKNHPLASLTKLMSAYLIIEDIENAKYDYDTIIQVTKEASQVKYGYRLKLNESYTIEDLLKLMLLNSSNSSAYLLAQNSEGNVENFVKRMNLKAKEFNLRSARFYTPHGLGPIDTNTKMDIANARDIYTLVKKVLAKEKIMQIVNDKDATLTNGKKVLSTNDLINKYEEVKGLKTGYHKKALFNIVYYMEFKNEKIIQIILGSNSKETRKELGEEIIKTMKSLEE